MSTSALLILNRWWIRELVNALLRPMFVRYREAERAGDAHRAEVCELRFLRLLNFCDCYPFCIEVDPCGLWILDEPSERDDFWRDEM